MTDTVVFEDTYEDIEVDEDTDGARIVFKSDSKVDNTISEEELELLYESFDINSDQINRKFSSWRLDVIHIRGVQDMSSEDILKYFDNFETKSIEWVNDLSCNVVFTDRKASAVALKTLTTGLVFKSNASVADKSRVAFDVIDAESLSVPIPPSFRWALGVSHPKSKALLLRFATNSDKKAAIHLPNTRFCVRNRTNPLLATNFKRSREDEIEIKAKRFRMRADEEQQRVHQRVAPKMANSRVDKSADNKTGRKSIWDRLDRETKTETFSPTDSHMIRISVDNSDNFKKTLLSDKEFSDNSLRSTISVVNRTKSAGARTQTDLRSRIGLKKF